MSRKVVHDDDITVGERWSQTLFDIWRALQFTKLEYLILNHVGVFQKAKPARQRKDKGGVL
jgi:hypothetical protein